MQQRAVPGFSQRLSAIFNITLIFLAFLVCFPFVLFVGGTLVSAALTWSAILLFLSTSLLSTAKVLFVEDILFKSKWSRIMAVVVFGVWFTLLFGIFYLPIHVSPEILGALSEGRLYFWGIGSLLFMIAVFLATFVGASRPFAKHMGPSFSLFDKSFFPFFHRVPRASLVNSMAWVSIAVEFVHLNALVLHMTKHNDTEPMSYIAAFFNYALLSFASTPPKATDKDKGLFANTHVYFEHQFEVAFACLVILTVVVIVLVCFLLTVEYFNYSNTTSPAIAYLLGIVRRRTATMDSKPTSYARNSTQYYELTDSYTSGFSHSDSLESLGKRTSRPSSVSSVLSAASSSEDFRHGQLNVLMAQEYAANAVPNIEFVPQEISSDNGSARARSASSIASSSSEATAAAAAAAAATANSTRTRQLSSNSDYESIEDDDDNEYGVAKHAATAKGINSIADETALRQRSANPLTAFRGPALRNVVDLEYTQRRRPLIGFRQRLRMWVVARFLPFFIEVTFLFFLFTLQRALSCTYANKESTAEVTLDSDSSMRCWTGAHRIYAIFSAWFLLMYVPLCTLASVLLNTGLPGREKFDIRFNGHFMLKERLGKFVICSLTTFFTAYPEYTVAPIFIISSYLAYDLITNRPCAALTANYYRAFSFATTAWTTLTTAMQLLLSKGEQEYFSVIFLWVGWIVIGFMCLVVAPRVWIPSGSIWRFAGFSGLPEAIVNTFDTRVYLEPVRKPLGPFRNDHPVYNYEGMSIDNKYVCFAQTCDNNIMAVTICVSEEVVQHDPGHRREFVHMLGEINGSVFTGRWVDSRGNVGVVSGGLAMAHNKPIDTSVAHVSHIMSVPVDNTAWRGRRLGFKVSGTDGELLLPDSGVFSWKYAYSSSLFKRYMFGLCYKDYVSFVLTRSKLFQVMGHVDDIDRARCSYVGHQFDFDGYVTSEQDDGRLYWAE